MSTSSTTTIAGFKCIEMRTGADPDGAIDLGVLLMHGLGADPSQFTSVVSIFLQSQPSLATKNIRWIFPGAPTQDGPVGSEWFPLDIMSWMIAFMGGEAVLGAKLREAVPGMNEASESVIRLLGELCSTTSGAGRSLKGWCVGGFSQGSMMACSVVSRLGLADQDRTMFQDNILSPGGLLILSGMPMNINEWVTGFQVCQFILFLFLFISQSFIDGLIVVFICTDFIENKFLYIFFFLLFFDLSSIKKEKVFKCYNFMVQMI